MEQSGFKESWTLDAASLRDFKRLDAQARRDDMQGIRNWLAYQAAVQTRSREAAD